MKPNCSLLEIGRRIFWTVFLFWRVQMSNTIQVYRRLLRSVDRNITAVTGNQLWRDFVRKEFRVERDALDVPELLQHATNYIFLVESVHKNRDLLKSYHIAVDKESQQRENVRKTAELVGLKLPEEEATRAKKETPANELIS